MRPVAVPCRKGLHDLDDPANVLIVDGARKCRPCRRARATERAMTYIRICRSDPSACNPHSFWSHVNQRGDGQCWLWMGGTDREGYGRHVGVPAHRVAYALSHGEIGEGNVIHHTCENRLCCNPDHLEEMTPGEHSRHHANGKRRAVA